MANNLGSKCLFAAVLACGTITVTAQQVMVRDFTTPEGMATAGNPNYWTAERKAIAVARPMPNPGTFSGSNAVNKAIPNSAPGDSSPGGAPQATPADMAELLADPAVADMIKASPEVAGTFATYPYPFTRFNTPSTLYDGAALSPYPTYPFSTVGKLFFRFGAGSFVCSASVIRPHLLLTARHCVLDAASGWATNVVFDPGYKSGANPKLKSWRARRLITWSLAGATASLKWDIAFIQTADENGTGCGGSSGGHPVEFYTGFLGWLYGGNVAVRNYSAFGYPQAAPFNGTIMVEAHSDVGNIDPLGQVGTFSIGNDMTGGSSGGPWIVGLLTNNFANGLNSFKWINPPRPLEMNSPNFQADNFHNLLVPAQALACP
jgi:V8-like Glu-specific endopeptidase